MIKIKNKYIILIFFTVFSVVFVFVNFINIKASFYNFFGNISYYNGNNYLAVIYHTKALQTTENDIFYYNLGGDYYNESFYEKSLENYLKIDLSNETKLFFSTYFNLGNTYYRLGEIENIDLEKKINLWKKSLLSYNQILLKKEDKRARFNYNFVSKKLEELLNNTKKTEGENNNKNNLNNKNTQELTDESEKQDENTSENNKLSTEQNKEEKNTNENKSDGKEQYIQGTRGDEYKAGEKNDLGNISENEKKELENYNRELKQDQLKNSMYFGKKNQGNSGDKILDIFKQDPFFNEFKNFDESNNLDAKDW